MSDRWLDAIHDIDLLNTLLNSDPALALNMAEMGFIARVPFQLDHNQATVAKWVLTESGRTEVMTRYMTHAGGRLNVN
jgi:hypothetical protein